MKHVSRHWLYQRITAIILVICSIWLVFFIESNIKKDFIAFTATIKKTHNVVLISMLIIISFYHAMLGMRVIIEDYVNHIMIRTSMIMMLQIFCIITIIIFIVAIFYMIIT